MKEKKEPKVKQSDDEKVIEYMEKLEHPLKIEINLLRSIIKGANEKISERIKWAAPSYYYKKDLVTFNHRSVKKVHLVFHNEAIVKIDSALLEGDYKDRRMAYFKDIQDIESNKKELERIINFLVQEMDK